MMPQLQVADSLLAGTSKAAERAVDYFLGRSRAWLLVGRTHRRYHAGIGLHPAAALAASAGERRLEPAHADR